ncbi:MAG TPA: ABC transporter permease [Chitinophagaceae bacterium]|jgi:putative ABC transport system permease protein
MIKNYFKIALRQLWKNKFYSGINILGLAIGLTSCLLILLYVNYELSYDQFHKNRDSIYRITETFKVSNGTMSTGLTPYKIAPDLKDHFPAIEKIVRIDADIDRFVIENGNKKFFERSVTSADPDFFQVFSFQLLKGNPGTALKEPYTIVISDKEAEKYFPGKEALGETLRLTDPFDHKSFNAKITGVFKAMPANSHFHRDFILSMATADILIPQRKDELGWTSVYSYLLLTPGTDAKKLETDIHNYIFKNYPENAVQWWTDFPLLPLNNIHLHSALKEELEPNGDIAYIYIFSAIAFFIMLLACINYMNLATARAARRAREVGIRKVIGAERKQLIGQFLGESIIVTMLALGIAIILTKFSLPFFNSLSEKNIQLTIADSKLLWIITAITFLLGIITGVYPAFFLSAFKPIDVLKGSTIKTGNHSLFLRKGLVVLQFTISIGLIAGTIIIYRQWDYLQKQKLGINSAQTIIVPAQTTILREKYSLLKAELLQNNAIAAVTSSFKSFTNRIANYSSATIGEKQLQSMPWTTVDNDFFKTFNIPIVSGTDFLGKPIKDSIPEFIINESAAQLFGMAHPEGKIIQTLGTRGVISGVCKDFHYESLHTAISPMVFGLSTDRMNYTAIKVRSNNINNTINYIRDQFKKIDPSFLFEYSFLDDDINAMYTSEARFFRVFTVFASLAIFIACLGILGLAAFMASQRTKEIGIRKVLGASVQNISLLLTMDFIKLVLIANFIAWPVAWYFMQKWLDHFPYRISISIWIFLSAAMMALIIASITVGFQAIKAAIANPVKSLRTE